MKAVEQLVVDQLDKCRLLTSDVNKYNKISEQFILFDEPRRIPQDISTTVLNESGHTMYTGWACTRSGLQPRSTYITEERRPKF